MLYRPLAHTTALFLSWWGGTDEFPSVSQYMTELQRGTTGGAMGLRVGDSDGSPDGELEGVEDGELEGAKEGTLEGAKEGALDGAKEGALDGAKEGVLDGCVVGDFVGGGSVQSGRHKASASAQGKQGGRHGCHIQKHATVRTLALDHGARAIHSEKKRTRTGTNSACNLKLIDCSQGRLPAH
jgi:hypothetical protein